MKYLIFITFLFISPIHEDRLEVYAPGVVYGERADNFIIKP